MNDLLKEKYNAILKEYFDYDSLKDKQLEIIYNLLEKKQDICAVLATGYGKSICYQLPFLITQKSVIIISPLISLMVDQKLEMEKRNIPVCCFNSDCKITEKLKNITSILNGNHKIIYMTPEYLLRSAEDFIKQLNDNDYISLICIDEAHCVSSWGNDFRETYTKLNIIKKWIPNIPILAVTATASEKIRKDICKLLELNNPLFIIGSFDRPNLYIKVQQKQDIKSDLLNLLEKFKDQYIIIYCKTRDDTEQIAGVINKLGIKSFAYHAGLQNNERDNIQKKFNNGDYKCIVATIAFGMGINIPNIRLVIHYGCPKNLESYYQEIGRAGRDGKYSECHLFYSTKDFTLNRYFIKNIENIEYRKYYEQEIRNIEKYIYTTECRRKVLLANFGENIDHCTKCDNCLNKVNQNDKDFTLPSHKLLSLIYNLHGKFGAGTFISILNGNKKHNNFEASGSGKEYTQEFWKKLIRILINNDYLKEIPIAGNFGSTIECTKKAIDWLVQMEEYQDLNDNNIKQQDKLIFTITNDFILKKTDNNNINHNTRWTNNEEKILLDKIASNSKIIDISHQLKRTSGAIVARLKHIACNLDKEGKSLNEIKKITNLTIEQITNAIKGNKRIVNHVEN